MDMQSRVPEWLTPLAWIFIASALLSAAWIASDIYLRRHRHGSVASELVWVTSALYLGPFAVPIYLRSGRTGAAGTTSARRSAAVAALPGGGASAVAHLIGVPLVVASGLTIAGIDLWVMIIVIGVLATVLLFGYERAAGAGQQQQGTGARRGVTVGAAATAALLTVLAFDVGMGGWMLLLHYNALMPPATEGSFWFLMQIGILIGLVTGYPVVRWLVRRGRTVLPA